MKKVKIAAMAALLGIMSVTAVQAGPCANKQKQSKHMYHKNVSMQNIFKQLDLSNEQKAALQVQRQEMKQNRRAMYAQMKGKRTRGQFIGIDGFDKQGYIDAQMQQAKIRAEMHAQRFEKTMQILTAQQREKFVALLKEQNK